MACWAMRTAALLLLSLIFGCASEPVHEPLVCDPAAADHVALGYQWVNDFIELPAYQTHGRRMLVIDGSCRYFVLRADGEPTEMRAGVLDEDELAEINASLMTGPWAAIDGVHPRGGGIDAAWIAVWRDGLGGSCQNSCGDAPAPLARLAGEAERWIELLHARGDEPTGPVRLIVSPGEGVGARREAWTGNTDLAGLLRDRSVPYGIRIDDPADAALLRAWRDALPENTQLAISDEELVWTVMVMDETPFDDENGYLRPPFAVPGSVPR